MKLKIFFSDLDTPIFSYGKIIRTMLTREAFVVFKHNFGPNDNGFKLYALKSITIEDRRLTAHLSYATWVFTNAT